MEIKYLKHDEIDKMQWDKCINRAFNGIVYAYSWYLDIVAYKWEALVLGDYDAIMPLTGKKKHGLNYIFQPKYTQQLGVFSNKVLNAELVDSFLKAIPNKYKLIHVNLNTYNKLDTNKYLHTEGITYELDLIPSYKQIFSKFSTNTKRNINKANKLGVHVTKHVNLKELLLLKKSTSKIPITFEHLNILRRVIPFTINHNLGETYGAYNNKNELIAAAYFIRSHNKVIYLLSASNDFGKEQRGMFAIVNQFIKDNSEKNITLDFEGSSIESLARFYKGFGATPINFFKININRLPWVLRLFIK